MIQHVATEIHGMVVEITCHGPGQFTTEVRTERADVSARGSLVDLWTRGSLPALPGSRIAEVPIAPHVVDAIDEWCNGYMP